MYLRSGSLQGEWGELQQKLVALALEIAGAGAGVVVSAVVVAVVVVVAAAASCLFVAINERTCVALIRVVLHKSRSIGGDSV